MSPPHTAPPPAADRPTPSAASAAPGSDPPPARTRRPGAPKGNKNALKHGAYAADPDPPDPDDLGAIIARQKARLRQLERYIDDRFPDLEPDQYKGLVALQSQMAGRISRMERDRAKLQAEAPDRADDDVGEALEIVSQVLGIDLTGQP